MFPQENVPMEKICVNKGFEYQSSSRLWRNGRINNAINFIAGYFLSWGGIWKNVHLQLKVQYESFMPSNMTKLSYVTHKTDSPLILSHLQYLQLNIGKKLFYDIVYRLFIRTNLWMVFLSHSTNDFKFKYFTVRKWIVPFERGKISNSDIFFVKESHYIFFK